MTALVPYLAVRDARAAIAWYADALGAQVVGDPYVMDDDRIGHAELAVAGATLYLADEYPEMGLDRPGRRPGQRLPAPAVPDVDAAVDRAVTVGATLERPPADAPVRPHRRDRRPVRPPLDAADPVAARVDGPASGRRRLPDPPGARRRPRPRLLRGGARLVDGARPRARRLAGRRARPR